ncbi:MAG: hypothetical protein HOH04_03130 [Rhodospirillaceae bacterium]|nr:hypothetical protein [Rhodospirillaceae bacterium]
MSQYVSLFIEGPSQLVALSAVGLVWLGFIALGAFVGGRDRMPEIDHLIGWALVSFLFTVPGVLIGAHFLPLAALAGLAAVGAGIFVWRRDHGLLPPGLGRVLILGLPLLVLAAGMKGSQWDEFTDWLVIPRYLLETDAFPSSDNLFSKAVFTGYPYSWHFVSYLAGRVGGRLLESAGALSNILLLFGFALLVVRLMLLGAGRHPSGERIGWALAALAMLASTLINPTFAQKIVLTAYAETASAVATATAAILAWFVLEALGRREFDRARHLALSLGLVLALLINLKQATLVLVVLVVLATLFVAVRDRQVPLGHFFRLMPLIVGPAILIYVTWRYHLASEIGSLELSVRPLDGWYIDLIPKILAKMLEVLSKKGVYLALGLILVGFGVRGFFRSQTPFDRFAALAAMVFLGYNAFLLFAYVATFGKSDALRAASYWRYNMHLGGLVVAFTAYGGAILWRQRVEKRWAARRIAWLPIMLVIAAPFIFAHKLRFDREPMTVHFRYVGAGAAKLVDVNDYVFNADPKGSGESSAALSYELGERAQYGGHVSAFHADRLKVFREALAKPKITAVIVHSSVDGFEGVVGVPLPQSHSHLLMRSGSGNGADGWRLVQSWPQPTKN